MDLSKIAEFTNPFLSAVFGAPGLWAFIEAKFNNGSAEKKLLRTLVRDRIISDGERYLERGYILSGEFSDFYEELYKPYEEMGGNGLAHHIFERIEKLPMLPDGSEGRKTS